MSIAPVAHSVAKRKIRPAMQAIGMEALILFGNMDSGERVIATTWVPSRWIFQNQASPPVGRS